MHIGFINYLNNYSELDYFLDMINKLDINTAKELDLEIYTVVAPHENISEIRDKVNTIRITDKLKDFDFANVELGIVPSLMKETISESTIYFLNHDIPILSGSEGGDSELCESGLFVYNTDDEFKVKFERLKSQPELLKLYGENYNENTKTFLEEVNEEAKNCNKKHG